MDEALTTAMGLDVGAKLEDYCEVLEWLAARGRAA